MIWQQILCGFAPEDMTPERAERVMYMLAERTLEHAETCTQLRQEAHLTMVSVSLRVYCVMVRCRHWHCIMGLLTEPTQTPKPSECGLRHNGGSLSAGRWI